MNERTPYTHSLPRLSLQYVLIVKVGRFYTPGS